MLSTTRAVPSAAIAEVACSIAFPSGFALLATGAQAPPSECPIYFLEFSSQVFHKPQRPPVKKGQIERFVRGQCDKKENIRILKSYFHVHRTFYRGCDRVCSCYRARCRLPLPIASSSSSWYASSSSERTVYVALITNLLDDHMLLLLLLPISICCKIYWRGKSVRTHTHVFYPTCTHAHTQTCSPSSSRIMPHHTRFSRGIHTHPCYQLHGSISTCPLCTYYVLIFDHLSQPSDDAPQVLPLLLFLFFLMLLL